MRILKYNIPIILGIIIVFNINLCGQFEWQNPLEFHDKTTLLLNIGGLFLTKHLNKEKQYNKTWESNIYIGYLEEYDPDFQKSNLRFINYGLGRQAFKMLQYGLEAQYYNFKNSEKATHGLGSAIFFNWYLVNRPKFKLHFENSFGIIISSKEFPDGGTVFNFTKTYGLTTSFKIKNDSFLKVGLRNLHISNAFLFGEDRNPSYDAVGAYLGFTIKILPSKSFEAIGVVD